MTKGPARLQTELEKAELTDRLEAEMLDKLIEEQEQERQEKKKDER